MKLSKTSLMPLIMAVLVVTLYSCKAKKIAQAPQNPEPVASAPAPQPAPAPVEEKKEEAPVVVKPDYNFSNIQFEFNSSVLKTSSYTVLDQIAREIKKDPSAQFNVGGHSSAEGTPERNMTLSKDRAVSVKSYLVSSGINSNTLITNGYGENKPIVLNDTESNRAQNRRVEVIKQ